LPAFAALRFLALVFSAEFMAATPGGLPSRATDRDRSYAKIANES